MRLRAGRLPLLAAALTALALVVPALGAVPHSGYAGSLLATAPVDEPTSPPSCTSREHPIAAEERLAGSRGWQGTLDPSPVVGYLDRSSVRCGDRVGVHLSGRGPVHVTAYRVGWYGGTGARLVWTSPRLVLRPQPAPPLEPVTLMAEASWPSSYDLTVPADWVAGLYLLVVAPVGSRQPPGAGAVMPLVVEHTGAKLLAVASTLTWAAYNPYGGSSTYYGPKRSTEKRTTVASLDRPLTGSGLHHLIAYDLPLARFLGRAAIEADWTTDEQLDARPGLAAAHNAVVFPGHSEYWTARMYDGVEAARNHGVNIAFLGADPVYWQARLASSPTGPRRRLVSYKDAEKDPVSATDPASTTVRWQDAPLNRDEAELVGTTYAASGVHAGMQVADAPDWLLEGTGLTTGSGLVGAAANEVDRLSTNETAPPPNLQVVLRGAYTTPGGALGDFASTYYTAAGGGAVFAAGTTAWPCGLDNSCPFGPVPDATSAALRRISANVLRGFVINGFATAHPSQASDVQPLAAFWRQLPESLRGTGGVHEPDGLNED